MIIIAFVIDTIESPTAGTEKQLLLLIKHLDRSKFKPYLCVLRSSKWLREEFHDCEVVDIGVPSFRKYESYRNIWKLVRFLKNNQVNIVQTHFIDGNKVGVLAAKLACVNAVVSTRRNQGYWHNPIEKYFLKILNKWVTLFLANSISTAQWIEKAEGIASSRVHVIHNGIEVMQYVTSHEERNKVRTQLGIINGVRVIGIVANLRPVKGLDTFLNAAKLVLESNSKVQFLIIGEGDEHQKLMKFAHALGIEKHVNFLGRCENIPSLLAAFDIGVLTSYSESFSNAIVEYMAAGLPVVCTDVGGAREAVEEGNNGFLVPSGDYTVLADKLNEILASNDLRKLGYASRYRAKTLFSIETMMEHTQNLYTKLAGGI